MSVPENDTPKTSPDQRPAVKELTTELEPHKQPDSETGIELSLITKLNESATLAHKGLVKGVREIRLRRAKKTAEKMERKQTLYKSMGELALGEKNIGNGNDNDPRPQTAPERIMDWRLSRRAHKHAVAKTFAYRSSLIHGEDSAESVPSVRHGLKTSLLEPVAGRPKHGMWFGLVVYKNIVRFFKGPDIPGKTRFRKFLEKSRIATGALMGEHTADEARLKWYKVGGSNLKYGNKSHKLSRRELRKRKELTELAADQPILKTWRKKRLLKATRRIDELENKLKIGGNNNQKTSQTIDRASKLATIADLIDVDDNWRAHRNIKKSADRAGDGRFVSNYELDLIAENQGLIRGKESLKAKLARAKRVRQAARQAEKKHRVKS